MKSLLLKFAALVCFYLLLALLINGFFHETTINTYQIKGETFQGVLVRTTYQASSEYRFTGYVTDKVTSQALYILDSGFEPVAHRMHCHTKITNRLECTFASGNLHEYGTIKYAAEEVPIH